MYFVLCTSISEVILKFKHGQRRQPIDYEADLVKYWQSNDIFKKSVQQRPADNAYVFYDGPPFITGEPHLGTLLSSIIKDSVPRYQTMRGKRVERVWGWDCHGLPAEVFTEKKLGINDKSAIGTKISLEEYITTCRDNMVQTGNLWEDTINRIGRWVDFKGAYKTMDKDYMESVWWAFKSLYDKGKIYEGEKVLLYCPRDATPISKAEVAMDNSYQEVSDPSVYVKFKLSNQDAYLLAWTTTPWTLLSNSAIAINQDLIYSLVVVDSQKFILAKNLIAQALTDEKHQPLEYKTIKSFKGSELVGQTYEPLFSDNQNLGKLAYKIWHADFVHELEGTGVAHESPAYGEEDYLLSKKHNFPWFINSDEYGRFKQGPYQGQNVWEANKQIAKDLQAQGIVWKIKYIQHAYPHCHRCGSKLIYRAHPSWFMDIDSQRQAMLAANSEVNWFPNHIKEGRSAKTIASAPDWNISRDRFWATAMPVWKATDKNGQEKVKVIGSYAELKELSGRELDDYHRPWVDDISFKIDGLEYRRIDKVLDCWFESGSMPFAQFHYPFENQSKFETSYPGDFIVEYVGQVRAWFYYLNAVNVGLFDSKAFKNVIVTGTITGNDGRKLSKSFGNYTNPNELMDKYSADALRFLLLSSPLLSGEDYSVIDKNVADVSRKLAMIWNVYDFFTLYADVDKWSWTGQMMGQQEPNNLLDRWIIARVHQLNTEITKNMDNYEVAQAVNSILPFIDDVSNWYVRRSRKRFWKSDDDSDKQFAYQTLHYILLQFSILVAPFVPFLAEELFLKLTGGQKGPSVHLLDWPEVGHVDNLLIDDTADLRNVISQGLAKRAEASIKVRQPLSNATLISAINSSRPTDYQQFLMEIAKDELNVKTIELTSGQNDQPNIKLNMKITAELAAEGQARELIRLIQNSRKAAGLNIDDRIKLGLTTKFESLKKAIINHKSEIMAETLASELNLSLVEGYKADFDIENQVIQISLHKI